ncbi:hypothetical protein BJ508DRAFT_24740 [Ascobolus immersus RN42]|uniref:Uncharacterized protein n=1 Tax=Ascobolus immersus RN42 TaxID=1160509 RepID=A0A3N4HMQ2_ASCIM|nr:hypothetical protein BJ508DRAFT_24740 [Ascobolus immersus RN42]
MPPLIKTLTATHHPTPHILHLTWTSPLSSLLPSSSRSHRRTSVGELGEWSITWPSQDTAITTAKGFHKGLVEELKAAGGGGKSGEGSGLPPAMTSGGVEMVQTKKGEDFGGLFSSRAWVRAPERIAPDTTEDGEEDVTFIVYYLLSPTYTPPKEVHLSYTPLSWSPSPPTEAGTFPITTSTEPTEAATQWARLRLDDLRNLSALAQELTTSGSRARTTGLLKRGVDGSGMDISEILQEARMVEEEMRWIEDTFLGAGVNFTGYGVGAEEEAEGEEDEKEAIEKALAEMQRLATELRLERASSPIVGPGEGPSFARPTSDFETRLREGNLGRTASLNAALGFAPPQRPSVQTAPSPIPHDRDDDPEASPLFAVPLSPRSPDMPISPFSLLKGIPESIFATTHPAGPSGPSASAPASKATREKPAGIFIPKGPVAELPGIVVRSPREPTTPTLAMMPSPEHLKRKMNWGAGR